MPSEYNPNETARDWEAFQKNESGDKTERLRVAGGWLYRTVVPGVGVGLTFAPSPTGD